MTKAIKNGCTRRIAGCLGLLLSLQPAAGLAALSSHEAIHQESSQEQLLAQRSGGGSRGGGSRGGGSRSSGSRSSGSRSSGRTGFSSYSGSGSRSSSRQSNQGSRQTNRQTNQSNRQGTRDTRQTNRNDAVNSRQDGRQGTRDTRQTNRNDAINSRQDGRTDRTDIRQSNRTDRTNIRNDTYRKAINNWDRYGKGWYSGGNWYNNRPWSYGWYGGSYWNNWGWYPGQAAAWGLAGLATFSVINSLVNSAQNQQVSYIVVPSSDYSLYYPSITATGDVVTFEADDGYETVRYSANCRQGTLNGSTPRNANEAQLLNAACQVAFGQ
jgi:hypothetical protein